MFRCVSWVNCLKMQRSAWLPHFTRFAGGRLPEEQVFFLSFCFFCFRAIFAKRASDSLPCSRKKIFIIACIIAVIIGIIVAVYYITK